MPDGACYAQPVVPCVYKKTPLCGAGKWEQKGMSVLLAGDWLRDKARAETAGANAQRAHCAVRRLVAHPLEIGRKTAFCLDIGMTYKIANLRLFAAKIALFTHD